jgi:methyltransferase-like protein 6
MVALAWSTSAWASLSAAGARRDDPPRGRRHAPPPTTRSRRCRATRDEGEGSATTSASSSTSASSESSRVSLANADASRAWERFYRTHSGGDSAGLATSRERSDERPSEKNPPANVTAFKDRHYLRKAFSDLMPQCVRDDPSAWVDPIDPRTTRAPDEFSTDSKLVLELGCGVGNSAFPLMRANLDLRVVAVDCSPTAIAFLKANQEFDARRCRAFCADLGNVEGPLTKEAVGSERFVEDESIDAVTGVFFFSALDADAFARVARECARVLKKNGLVLFRDYSKEDVKGTDGPSTDFAPGQKVDEDAYVRGDGTLAVFFDEAFVTRVFQDAGFVGSCERVTHEVTNRKLGITFTRHFVQGRFVKP